MTDYIVIGAGISGCTIAYFLNKQQHSILLLDQKAIASSGSGAAGAFLSPMIGVDNHFKQLVNDALKYSIDFYTHFFPHLIEKRGVQRVPKDKDDLLKFKIYEKYIKDLKYTKKDKNEYGGGFYFDIGARVEAKEVCYELVKDIEFKQIRVKSLIKKDGYWIVEGRKCKNIILATGAYDSLIDESYIKIKRLWGQRIDIKSSTYIPYSIHKNCSISNSKDGNISIGATYHRGVLEQECSDEDSDTLLKKANEIVELKDVKVVKSIGGARSASDDYYPIIGPIIDSKASQHRFPNLKNGIKIDENKYSYYDNLFIINALGSRAFVLAPYIAKNLSEFLINKKPILSNCSTTRVFERWVKKQR